MNRTIEQWAAIGAPGCGQLYNSKHAVGKLLTDAVRDLQELARQRDELLARIGAAEAQRDYALNELEFIASTDSIDAALDPDRAIRVAKAAVKFIKEQTK